MVSTSAAQVSTRGYWPTSRFCITGFVSLVATGGLIYLGSFHLLLASRGLSTLEFLSQQFPEKIAGYAEQTPKVEQSVGVELEDLGPPPDGRPPMPVEWTTAPVESGGSGGSGEVWTPAEIHVELSVVEQHEKAKQQEDHLAPPQYSDSDGDEQKAAVSDVESSESGTGVGLGEDKPPIPSDRRGKCDGETVGAESLGQGGSTCEGGRLRGTGLARFGGAPRGAPPVD